MERSLGGVRGRELRGLPEALAEGELFGYRKGAFTGAERSSPGHFRAAHRGTLLLDEIADLSLSLQAKLLRVLEEAEVVPLGESTPVSVDVRILAACQGSLRAAVAKGCFRADLLARLDGLEVRLPPLRDRIEDVPYLFQRLLADHGGGGAPAVEARLVEQLCLYDWPFNVRELDLLVRRLLAIHEREPLLRRAHLPERVRAGRSAPTGLVSSDRRPDDDREAARDSDPVRSARVPRAPGGPSEAPAERDVDALVAALRRHGGNVAQASAELGISRQRAYRLMAWNADVDLQRLRTER